MKKFKLFRIPLVMGMLGAVLTLSACDDETEGDNTKTLSAPVNISATVEDATVVVAWDAVEGAETYEVMRTFDLVESTYNAATNSYTDASPGEGSNFYMVRALADGVKTSEWSISVACTYEKTGDGGEEEEKLAGPENISAEQDENTVILTWDAVEGATSYNIYKGNLTTGVYHLMDTSTEATYIDEEPDNDLNYYKVTAVVDEKETDFSKAATLNFSSVRFRYKDAVDAYKAFNNQLYNTSMNMYRRNSTDGDGSWAVNWTQSMMFDMIMNAYRLTEDTEHLQRMADMYLKGCPEYCRFDWYNSTDGRWKWDLYDDPMWWVGALARAYLFVKEFPEAEDYGLDADQILATAMEGFDRVWYGSTTTSGTDYPELDAYGSYSGDDPATVYYNSNGSQRTNTDNHKGGMFWDWKFRRTGKMSCITFPTIIAAMHLHAAVPDYVDNFNGPSAVNIISGYVKGNYLDKAKDLYQWATASLATGGHLYRTSDGAVADSKHIGNNSSNFSTTVYNQATCMGAGALLYLETGDDKYLTVAKGAMNYLVANKTTPAGTIQVGDGEEFGIHNAILAQYIPLLITDCGQDQYLTVLETSIQQGWNNRGTTRLCNKDFTKTGPTAGSSYTTAGIPALMLTFPDIKNRK